jgi:molybdopterin converting factor small subunit
VATAPHDRTVPHGAAQAALTLVRVRYFAGARAAAGVAEEDVRLPAATVRSVLSAVRERRGPELDRVLARCSFLLNGVAVHDHATGIPDRAELDVLPPFAGG